MVLVGQADPAAKKREKFGHKYLSEEDLSRLATGNLTVSAALRMVKRTL